MQQNYSRFYILNRTDLFKEKKPTYKQVILTEGESQDNNLYMV